MCWGKDEYTFLKGRIADEERTESEAKPTWSREPEEEPDEAREREEVLEPV